MEIDLDSVIFYTRTIFIFLNIPPKKDSLSKTLTFVFLGELLQWLLM